MQVKAESGSYGAVEPLDAFHEKGGVQFFMLIGCPRLYPAVSYRMHGARCFCSSVRDLGGGGGVGNPALDERLGQRARGI